MLTTSMFSQNVTQMMNQAKTFLVDSNTVEANKIFLKLANKDTILPDEYCFHLGKSIFIGGSPRRSKAFFYKYIELTDSVGLYHKEALYYLLLSGEPVGVSNQVKEDSTIATASNSTDSSHHDHNHAEIHGFEEEDPCEGYSTVVCPICNGLGVIIEKTEFGKTYRECSYSDDEGMMTCEQYKAYLRGELKP